MKVKAIQPKSGVKCQVSPLLLLVTCLVLRVAGYGQVQPLGLDLSGTPHTEVRLTGCGADTLLMGGDTHWLTLGDTGLVTLTLQRDSVVHSAILIRHGEGGWEQGVLWWDADSSLSGGNGLSLPNAWHSISYGSRLLALHGSMLQVEMMAGMHASLAWNNDPLQAQPLGNLKLFPGDYLFWLTPIGGVPLAVTHEVRP